MMCAAPLRPVRPVLRFRVQPRLTSKWKWNVAQVWVHDTQTNLWRCVQVIHPPHQLNSKWKRRFDAEGVGCCSRLRFYAAITWGGPRKADECPGSRGT